MAKSPEMTFRLRNIFCSVFVQESGGTEGSPKQEFRTTDVKRFYQDGDETKFSNNFTKGDLPLVFRCLELAQKYIEEREFEVA